MPGIPGLRSYNPGAKIAAPALSTGRVSGFRQMSTYRLERIFSARSVAVVGASPRPTSQRGAGFPGEIYLVNPHYDTVEGVKAVKSYAELSHAPDLAVIATPPASIPGIVADAARMGTPGAIIITAGL